MATTGFLHEGWGSKLRSSWDSKCSYQLHYLPNPSTQFWFVFSLYSLGMRHPLLCWRLGPWPMDPVIDKWLDHEDSDLDHHCVHNSMVVLRNGSQLKEAGHWFAFMGAMSCLKPFLYVLVLTWLGLWCHTLWSACHRLPKWSKLTGNWGSEGTMKNSHSLPRAIHLRCAAATKTASLIRSWVPGP